MLPYSLRSTLAPQTVNVTVATPQGPGAQPVSARPPMDVLLLIDGSSTCATLRASLSTLLPAVLSSLANATSSLRVGVARFIDLPSTGSGAVAYVVLLSPHPPYGADVCFYCVCARGMLCCLLCVHACVVFCCVCAHVLLANSCLLCVQT